MNIKGYLAAGLGALAIGAGTVKMCQPQEEKTATEVMEKVIEGNKALARSSKEANAALENIQDFANSVDTTNLAPLKKDTVDLEKAKTLIKDLQHQMKPQNTVDLEKAKKLTEILKTQSQSLNSTIEQAE